MNHLANHLIIQANHPRQITAVLRIFLTAVFLAFPHTIPDASASGSKEDAHFEAEAPENLKDAVTVSRNTRLSIESALAAGIYHEIHMATYTLEAAAKLIVDGLEEDSETGEAYAKRIEIVHLASELEDKAILDASVPALKTAMDAAIADLPKN